MLVDGEAVGHARDVVGDRARPARPAPAFAAQSGGMTDGSLEIGLEQPPDDRVRPLAHPAHVGMAVHMGEQERLESRSAASIAGE